MARFVQFKRIILIVCSIIIFVLSFKAQTIEAWDLKRNCKRFLKIKTNVIYLVLSNSMCHECVKHFISYRKKEIVVISLSEFDAPVNIKSTNAYLYYKRRFPIYSKKYGLFLSDNYIKFKPHDYYPQVLYVSKNGVLIYLDYKELSRQTLNFTKRLNLGSLKNGVVD